MHRGLASAVSFLTILPAPGSTLEQAARGMYLFPAAGAAIGAAAGALALALSYVLDPLLVGIAAAASVAVITGLHHADGLADFADGLMARGTREKRIAAMRDAATGSAGAAAVSLYMVGLAGVISAIDGPDLFRAIVAAEVLAKFSMVLAAALGRPAAPGSGSAFISAMRDRRRLAAACAIAAVPLAALGGAEVLVALGASVAVVLAVSAVSARAIGGITGDVLGATNELARAASLAVFMI